MRSIHKTFQLVFFTLLSIASTISSAQKYPSLLWEVTGNGLDKPSYLYGTMHVSNKIAFYLGDPFFKALESADLVALELEPEVWFDEVLSDKNKFKRNTSDYGGSGYGEWNMFRGFFEQNLNVNNTIKTFYMQDPMAYNTLLFRLYEASGNFEEETWLDMYIYQSARKLGKKTIGLESFELANEMMDKANKEISEEDESQRKKRKKLSYSEQREVSLKIEEAYRKANLDVLDSLSALMSHPSYTKYILYERNKNFVKGLDSMMQKQTVFAGFGAAHLPGENGCVELLRKLGYNVRPVSRGKRNAKKREKLENLILKRKVSTYTTPDGYLSFDVPVSAYSLGGSFHAGNILAMDIPNGTNFMINRIPSKSTFIQMTSDVQIESLDSLLYEVIPGEIISRKKISVSGYPTLDITNKTRRGDIHRSNIIFLPDEIILIRLSATGDKIKRGLANYFFPSIRINNVSVNDWNDISSVDGSFSYEAPGRPVSYNKNRDNQHLRTFREYVRSANGDMFVIYRIANNEAGYLEEDPYTYMMLEDAVANDLDIELSRNELIGEGKFRMRSVYEPYKGRKVFAMFESHALTNYIFLAFSNDSLAANRFFNSVKIGNSTFDTLYEMIDSAVFFKSEVPWEIDNKTRNSRNYYSYYSNEDPNPAERYVKYKSVYPPHSTDRIHISYERFGRYDYVHDTATFIDIIEKSITHGYDENIESKTITWDEQGMTADYYTSDTFSSRRYHFHIIWKGRRMHTIKTTYDNDLGEGPVSLAFLNKFKPLEDTLTYGSYLESQLEQFEKDILSDDTITFEGANDFIRTVFRQYKEEEVLRLFTLLKDTVSPLAEKEDKDFYKRSFIAMQYLDHSAKHLKKLAGEYRKSSDSSLRQMEILTILLKMNRKESHLLAKTLVLEEAPIGTTVGLYHPFFYKLLDSMELAKVFFPDILDLSAYEEYEKGVLLALTRMLDSGTINHQPYATYLSYLIREAKVQSRRFSSATQIEVDEDQVWRERDQNYNSDPLMLAYWKLLYPYISKVEVAAIYENAAKSAKKHVRENYALFLASKDIKISDKECEYLTAGLKPLHKYAMLDGLNRLDLLKDTNWLMVNLDDQIRSVGSKINKYGWKSFSVDSLEWTRSHDDSIRRKMYTTYYLKFKKTLEKETNWVYAVIMVEKTDEKYPPFEYLSSSAEIEVDQTEEELYKDIRDGLISNNRDNDYPSTVTRDIRNIGIGNMLSEEIFELGL